jgi:hypothetical protein
LGCLWGGYWFVGERGFEAAVRGWFETLQADGKIATNSGLAVHGFPNRFDLTVTDPHFADPATGVDWQAPFLQVLTLSYKPWHVIFALPNEQRLTLPAEAMTIRSAKLQASVVAKPLPSLPLDRMTLVGDGLEITGDQGWNVTADTLQFATRVDESRSNWHEVGLNVTNLAPDPQLIALFDGVLPPQLGVIRMDAHLGLSGPIDRTSLHSKARIAAVELKHLQVTWGSLGLSAKGNVIADSVGFAQGEAVLTLENWRVALDVAEKTGILTQDQRKLWERAAQFLSLQSGGGDSIALPLAFENGQTRIGPIPIGPAPRLRE